VRCLAALVGGLAVLAALTAPTATSAGTDLGAGYACYSLASSTPADCLAWHNQPVRLVWYLQPGTLDSPAGNCTPTAFKADGQFPVSCTVLTNPGSPTPKTETTTVTVGVDMTPPTITAATPTRAADSGSWFNHPVSFAFGGTDATSGIVSCDTVTFAGPGGPGAQVVGGCHDAAGNYATRGFAVNYDNTPPKLRAVRAAPANRGATVTWTPSSDTVTSQVTRSPGRRGARSTVVYSGPAHRFRDKGMVNGRAYRYTVTVLDQAGNPASKTVAARPRVSLGLKPSRGARLTHPPLLRWPAVGGASYYNVQVYRGRVKVLSAWPKRAHLKLHRQWSFLGQRFRLTPGHYRWYVWPGYGSLPAQHFGAFIGQSSFRIVR
jgi:hypothetical protein